MHIQEVKRLLNKFEAGTTYALSSSVENPVPDRRRTRDWFSSPTISAGTLITIGVARRESSYIVNDEVPPLFANFVIDDRSPASAPLVRRTRVPVRVEGRTYSSELYDLILQALGTSPKNSTAAAALNRIYLKYGMTPTRLLETMIENRMDNTSSVIGLGISPAALESVALGSDIREILKA